MRVRDAEPPRERRRGRPGGRLPPEAAIPGQRGRGRCSQDLLVVSKLPLRVVAIVWSSMPAVYGSRRRVSRGFFLCCSLARSVYKLSHDLRRMSIIRPSDRPCVTLWDGIRIEHRDTSGHTGKNVHEEMMNINPANYCTKPVFLAVTVCLAIRLWCGRWRRSHSRCAIVEATIGTCRLPVSLVRNLPPTTGLVMR